MRKIFACLVMAAILVSLPSLSMAADPPKATSGVSASSQQADIAGASAPQENKGEEKKTGANSNANDASQNTNGKGFAEFVAFAAALGFLLVSLGWVKKSLNSGGWSLVHALSEEVDSPKCSQPAPTAPAVGAAPVPAVPTGGFIAPDGTALVGSTSRLIAFMGMLVIMAFVIGVGLWLLWSLFSTNTVPSNLDKLTNFFYGSAMLFAPYAANQIKAALSAITK